MPLCACVCLYLYIYYNTCRYVRSQIANTTHSQRCCRTNERSHCHTCRKPQHGSAFDSRATHRLCTDSNGERIYRYPVSDRHLHRCVVIVNVRRACAVRVRVLRIYPPTFRHIIDPHYHQTHTSTHTHTETQPLNER